MKLYSSVLKYIRASGKVINFHQTLRTLLRKNSQENSAGLSVSEDILKIMEIDKTVISLKQTLITLEKKLPYPLSKFTGTSANYKTLRSDIVEALKPYFSQKDAPVLRSLHLLLLLNTELQISEELENDHNIGYVVNYLPKLSQCIYMISVVEFNLFDFVKEIVIDAPISLTLELINLTAKERTYLPPIAAFHVNGTILEGILTRIKFSDCDYINRKLFENFQSLMLFFKIEEKNEGYQILSLLKIIRTLLKLCFNLMPSPEANDLYNISLSTDVERWYNRNDLIDRNDILKDCLDKVFFKCRAFLYELDIDTFMNWHETEYQASTLQTTVGEETYYVRQLLMINKNSEFLPQEMFDIVEMLGSIVCEPKVKVEENFVEKLNAERLEELITEKEIDKHLLDAIKFFLQGDSNRFDTVISIKLIHKLCSKKVTEELDSESLKEVVLMLLRKCELKEAVSFLCDFLSEYGDESFIFQSTVDLSEVIKDINEVFNEEFAKNEELTIKKKNETFREIVTLAFRSPEFVLTTLVEQSILECNQQKGILELFNVLKPLCLHVPPNEDSSKVHPLLITVTERFLRCNFCKLSSPEKQLFTNLIVSLSQNGLVNNDEFLSHCLLPLLNLKTDISWEITTDLLKIFKEFYTSCVQESNLSTVIILIQLAQLLEQSRWNIESFASERLSACEEIISLIELFLQIYSKNPGPEKDKHWLSMQLRRFSYLTKSYFPYIYDHGESDRVDFLFLSLIHSASDVHTKFIKIENTDSTALIAPISEIIVNLTPKELQRIVSNYTIGNHQRVFHILIMLSDAVALLCEAANQYAALKNSDSGSICACLGHVINNYLNVLQVNISSCRLSEDQLNYIKCINRIAATIKCFPKHVIRTYQFNVMKIVNEILPTLKDTSNDFDGDTRQLLLGLFLL